MQYYRFFSGDYAQNKSKHILNSGILMQAVENGDLALHHGKAARQSVRAILSEIEALQSHMKEILNENEEKHSNE